MANAVQPNERANAGAKRIHPGAGRRSAPLYPKGRVLRQAEIDAVAQLIGPAPYERARC